MLRIALCDDERDRAEINAPLDQYVASRDISARARSFARANEPLSAVEDGGDFDLYLLDVLMPEMDGIKLGLALRKVDADGQIIYLTTTRDFAVESYGVSALHYLIKPVTEAALFPVLDKAASVLTKRRTAAIQVKTRDGAVHLDFDDIYYAELVDHAVRYVGKAGAVGSTYIRASFSEAIAPLLRSGQFFLCGSRIALNLYHVAETDKTGAVLSTGQRLELPRGACATLRTAWSDYWMGGNRE